MGEESVLPELDGSQGLEQFVLLSKTASGAAAARLIHDATNSNGLYVFGELLDTANVKALVGTEHEPLVKLLEIFTYGTYSDYKSNSETLPKLTNVQLNKLKHLTILEMAAKRKTIPYSTLQEELDIPNVRELEDLIIDAIYHNILQAKLDQSNNQLEVECFIGRDTREDQIDSMVDKLDQWCTNCLGVVNLLETQMIRANELKRDKLKQKDSLDKEIKSMKQAVSLSKELDLDYPDSSHKLLHIPKKGVRGSLARIKS